jgi:hypothetical protein
VPRKSGHTRNADLTRMRHGGGCPDLSGSACALRIGHDGKKDTPMLLNMSFLRSDLVFELENNPARCAGFGLSA